MSRIEKHIPDASVPVPTILDVEASGFGPRGYPIEVGFVNEDGSGYCTLIRPAASWTHWDNSAESVHGISRTVLLSKGRGVQEVARELNERLRGQVVYSDAWGNDYAWLSRLFDEAKIVPRFRVESLRALLNDDEAARWHEIKQSVEAEMSSERHRASRDAQVLQQALLRVKQTGKA